MADEAEVQRKIVELAGKINRAKQARQQQQFAPATQYAQPQHSQYTSTQSYRGGYHAYGNRWDPYTAPGGRGRGGYHQTFQNRKLVNATNSATPTTTPPTSAVHTPQQQQQDVQHVGQNTKSAQHDQAPAANRELVIGGIRFLMKEDGSKLTRITGELQIGYIIFKRGKIAKSLRRIHIIA